MGEGGTRRAKSFKLGPDRSEDRATGVVRCSAKKTKVRRAWAGLTRCSLSNTLGGGDESLGKEVRYGRRSSPILSVIQSHEKKR